MASVDELLRAGIERLRTAGSETPRLDAELLLAKALRVERAFLIANPSVSVGDGQRTVFEADCERRATGEPVAYIRGFKEFFGLAFAVDQRALIPRPETERIVELAEREVLDRLTATPRPAGASPLRIADVGTGSGTIAVSLAAALRRRRIVTEVEVLATDVSEAALDLARENAVGHGVADRVRFIEADLLPPVVSFPFDLVLANLPYIPSGDVPGLPVAASFEPLVALDGGPDGLSVVARLLARLPDALATEGVAFLEIGGDQADAITDRVTEVLPGWHVRIERDLGGQPRVARVEQLPLSSGNQTGAAAGASR